jgi:hypothetical protein
MPSLKMDGSVIVACAAATTANAAAARMAPRLRAYSSNVSTAGSREAISQSRVPIVRR